MRRALAQTTRLPHRAVRASRSESVGRRAWEQLSATRRQNASATVSFEVQGMQYRFTVTWDRLFGDATLRLFRVRRAQALVSRNLELEPGPRAKENFLYEVREMFARLA